MVRTADPTNHHSRGAGRPMSARASGAGEPPESPWHQGVVTTLGNIPGNRAHRLLGKPLQTASGQLSRRSRSGNTRGVCAQCLAARVHVRRKSYDFRYDRSEFCGNPTRTTDFTRLATSSAAPDASGDQREWTGCPKRSRFLWGCESGTKEKPPGRPQMGLTRGRRTS
jgi:hypothetical protein